MKKLLKLCDVLTVIVVVALMVTVVFATPGTDSNAGLCCASASVGSDSLMLISGGDTMRLSVPRHFDNVETIATFVTVVILIVLRLLLPVFVDKRKEGNYGK